MEATKSETRPRGRRLKKGEPGHLRGSKNKTTTALRTVDLAPFISLAPLPIPVNRKTYDKLCGQIRFAIAPDNKIDELLAGDLTNHMWKLRLLCRLQIGLAKSKAPAALKELLATVVEHPDRLKVLINGLVDRDPRMVRAAENILWEAGFNVDKYEETMPLGSEGRRIDACIKCVGARRRAIMDELGCLHDVRAYLDDIFVDLIHAECEKAYAEYGREAA